MKASGNNTIISFIVSVYGMKSSEKQQGGEINNKNKVKRSKDINNILQENLRKTAEDLVRVVSEYCNCTIVFWYSA